MIVINFNIENTEEYEFENILNWLSKDQDVNEVVKAGVLQRILEFRSSYLDYMDKELLRKIKLVDQEKVQELIKNVEEKEEPIVPIEE